MIKLNKKILKREKGKFGVSHDKLVKYQDVSINSRGLLVLLMETWVASIARYMGHVLVRLDTPCTQLSASLAGLLFFWCPSKIFRGLPTNLRAYAYG
jgi:hypothetical protein